MAGTKQGLSYPSVNNTPSADKAVNKQTSPIYYFNLLVMGLPSLFPSKASIVEDAFYSVLIDCKLSSDASITTSLF